MSAPLSPEAMAAIQAATELGLSSLRAHGAIFTMDRVGTPARVCRLLGPVRQPCTVHHLCLAAWVMG